MPQNTKICLVAVSLFAFPFVSMSGCGGGGGGPSVSPTPTALPGSVPTATPTVAPARTSYLLNATFSNRNADMPTNFTGADGQGTFANPEPPAIGFLSVNFLRTADETVDVSFNSLGKNKTGDVISLTNKFPINDAGLGFLLYSNFAKTQQFIAKNGTLRIDSITTFPVVLGTATKITFTIRNAQMVPNTGPGNTATGSFTFNATGEVTLIP